MKALVYKGPHALGLESRPIPDIVNPTDCIVKVALASVCTSDVHIREGFIPRAVPGTVLGHEFVGVVYKTGSGIRRVKAGDRVTASCLTICGECFFCKSQNFNCCTRGGWNIGCCKDGGLAEYVRVELADSSLDVIPDGLSFKNCLLVGDILASGLFGVEMVGPLVRDQRVLVIGAGPVGQCAGLIARNVYKARVSMVDVGPASRLRLAEENGACDAGFGSYAELDDFVSTLDLGGFDSVIECSGARGIVQVCQKYCRKCGTIGLVGMFDRPEPLDLVNYYGKNQTVRYGGCNAGHGAEIMDWIQKGLISTDYMVSREFGLDEVDEAIRVFETEKDSVMKVAIRME